MEPMSRSRSTCANQLRARFGGYAHLKSKFSFLSVTYGYTESDGFDPLIGSRSCWDAPNHSTSLGLGTVAHTRPAHFARRATPSRPFPLAPSGKSLA
jgi:hypothetical protein